MRWIFKGILGALAFGLFMLLFAWVTMSLWNWLVPTLFHGPMLTSFWQAFGLLILARLLTGGFHRGGRWGGRCGCYGGGWRGRGGHWRKRWEEKMANMTPEEKEKFRYGMSRCGWGGRWSDKWDDQCEPKKEESGSQQ